MPFLDSSVSSPLQRLVLLKNVSIVVKVKLKKKQKKKLEEAGESESLPDADSACTLPLCSLVVRARICDRVRSSHPTSATTG